MSSLNYLSIDSQLITDVNLLESVDASGHESIMENSIKLLEGLDISEDTVSLSTTHGINATALHKLCASTSALQWECAKLVSSKMSMPLADLLQQLGMSEILIDGFCKVLDLNRQRIQHLRDSLAVGTYAYRDIAWRLEVELARRNMHVQSDPKYLLRLDLSRPGHHAAAAAAAAAAISSSSVVGENAEKNLLDDSHCTQVHLQADYATMKYLQNELQRAVDEISNVHCQRISRYLS